MAQASSHFRHEWKCSTTPFPHIAMEFFANLLSRLPRFFDRLFTDVLKQFGQNFRRNFRSPSAAKNLNIGAGSIHGQNISEASSEKKRGENRQNVQVKIEEFFGLVCLYPRLESEGGVA